MPEKYLYKDKVLQRKEVEDAAKQSGMDIDTYSKKAGLQRVNDNYNFNGKTVPAEEIFEAAKQSKMGFDDYIQKAQIVPIDDVKKKLEGWTWKVLQWRLAIPFHNPMAWMEVKYQQLKCTISLMEKW